MERLLSVTFLLSIALVGLVLSGVRRAHIRVEYSVAWLAAALVLAGLSVHEAPLRHMSELLGVTYPPVALLLVMMCVFVVVFYRFSLRISDLKDANIELAQRIAILEYRLQSLHEDRES